MCHKWNMKHIDELIAEDEKSAFWWAFHKLPDYPWVLFSFKPLKLESWLSKEIIDKLMS